MKQSTKISPSDFTRLIKQANVPISEEAKLIVREQLGDALKAVEILADLDTTKVGNTTSASGLTNVLREDVVTPSLPQELALQNASSTHDGFFMVPAIFESEDN